MEKKTIIYIVGGIAVLGIGYYLYNKNKKKTASSTPVAETKSEGETIDVTLKPKMEKPEREGRGQGKPKNPMASETITAVGTSTPPASTPPTSTPASTTTKLTNLEVEKRIFTACGIKPSGLFKERRNQWDECKDRTKANLKAQGLISFDGMSSYSNMTSDFDISFR
jgi:hypothetical protein